MTRLALYIHWPFCQSKCPYCDFNSHVRDNVEQNIWLDSFKSEIDHYKKLLSNRQITSIFFGGGTPSLMNPKTVSGILEYVHKTWNIGDIEITIEANPSSSEISNFKKLKDAGINRISIGIQSFDENELSFLGRRHNSKEAKMALEAANKIFDNFSFDLIYALPGQTEKKLDESLDIALGFSPSHISLYQLTIEKGTEFFKEHRNGVFMLPDEERSVELYQHVNQRLKNEGLERYEISNYAKERKECMHNLSYWKYDEYLGIGPGAHSRIDIGGKRHAIFDIHNPEKWLKTIALKGHGIQSDTLLSYSQMADELIFMALRIEEGLDINRFEEISGYRFYDIIHADIIDRLAEENLLLKDENKLKLTEKGLLVHSSVCKAISDNKTGEVSKKVC